MLRYEASVHVTFLEVFVTRQVNQEVDVGFEASNL